MCVATAEEREKIRLRRKEINGEIISQGLLSAFEQNEINSFQLRESPTPASIDAIMASAIVLHHVPPLNSTAVNSPLIFMDALLSKAKFNQRSFR